MQLEESGSVLTYAYKGNNKYSSVLARINFNYQKAKVEVLLEENPKK